MRQMFDEKHVRAIVKELILEMQSKIIKVNDITKLSDEQCEALECGNFVVEETDTGDYTYLVTFKKKNTCIDLARYYSEASRDLNQETVGPLTQWHVIYELKDGHWLPKLDKAIKM